MSYWSGSEKCFCYGSWLRKICHSVWTSWSSSTATTGWGGFQAYQNQSVYRGLIIHLEKFQLSFALRIISSFKSSTILSVSIFTENESLKSLIWLWGSDIAFIKQNLPTKDDALDVDGKIFGAVRGGDNNSSTLNVKVDSRRGSIGFGESSCLVGVRNTLFVWRVINLQDASLMNYS